jgi:anaerobic magnesium-protoporphyrin IX monomethyl ester cyclase
MKAVCRAIEPYKMHITFPNGLRFDILDEEGCDALVRAGTYGACVAIETITPRLQELIKKHLRVERAQQAIRWMAGRGVLVRGFFMLGFPTETREEIEATVSYAVNSDLAQAYFFDVVPQPGTPLYDLAYQESPAALESQTLQEYNARNGFYTAAYGVNMQMVKKWAYVRFFVLSPRRWVKLVRMMPWKNFVSEFRDFVAILLYRKPIENEPLPEALLALSHLYAADDQALTSAQTQRKKPAQRAVPSLT